MKAALDAWLDTERERLALWLPVFMGIGVLGYYALRFEPQSGGSRPLWFRCW